MSRLDSFIRRMQAQRDCLNWAAAALAGRPGVVLELGLGNGRTYDHLREHLPDRAIYVFDRQVAAHPRCIPPCDRLFLGEIAETLPAALARLGGGVAALVHSDLGTGDAAADAALSAAIAPLLAPLLAPDGLVVSSHPFAEARWTALAPPPGVSPGRYFLYRANRSEHGAPSCPEDGDSALRSLQGRQGRCRATASADAPAPAESPPGRCS